MKDAQPRGRKAAGIPRQVPLILDELDKRIGRARTLGDCDVDAIVDALRHKLH